MLTFKLKSQNNHLADSPFELIIEHLPPCCQVKVRLDLDHYYNINAPMNLSSQAPWQAEALFYSDDKGILDLSESNPYHNLSIMELFFKSQPIVCKKAKLSQQLESIPLNPFYDLKISIFKGHSLLGETSVRRYYQLPSISCLDLNFSRAKGRFFYDKTSSQQPAIIVLSGSDGRIEKAQNIAQLLASHGFTTLALAYFGLEGLASHLEKIPLEIIQEAIDYLKKSPYADSIRLGLYGRSKGAEFALLAASHYDDFECLVLNSPSYLCLEGLKQWRNSKTSSWTYQGQELPYHPFLWKDFFQRLILKKDLKNINHQAVIPVEKINGSLLLLVSKKDEVWDAYGSAITIVNRLQQKRFKYPYQVESYENCGHMMTVAYQPNHRYKKVALEKIMADTNDSWQKTLAFFRNRL